MLPGPADQPSNFFQAQVKRQSRSLRSMAGLVLLLMLAQPLIWWWTHAMASRLQASRTYSRQSQEILRQAEMVKNNYENQQIILEHLLAVSPTDNNTLPLLDQLESIGKEVGVSTQITAIEKGANLTTDGKTTAKEQTPPTTKTSEPNKLPLFPLAVTIKATGSASTLLDYLEKVEHVQELTQVIDFKIATSATPSTSQLDTSRPYAMDLKLNFYLQPSNE